VNPATASVPDRVCYRSIYFDSSLTYIGYWASARVDGRQYDQRYVMVLPVSFLSAARLTPV